MLCAGLLGWDQSAGARHWHGSSVLSIATVYRVSQIGCRATPTLSAHVCFVGPGGRGAAFGFGVGNGMKLRRVLRIEVGCKGSLSSLWARCRNPPRPLAPPGRSVKGGPGVLGTPEKTCSCQKDCRDRSDLHPQPGKATRCRRRHHNHRPKPQLVDPVDGKHQVTSYGAGRVYML